MANTIQTKGWKQKGYEMQLLWDNRDGRWTQHGEILEGNMEVGSSEVCSEGYIIEDT